MRRALVVAMTVLCLASASASARPGARVRAACRVPHLSGLTLAVARKSAAHARCTLRVKGAAVEQPGVQTVERQSPRASRRSPSVTVWLNPVCRGSAAYGPGIMEPAVTPGPSQLVSGFYLVGGRLTRFSAPGCKRPAQSPAGGTVEVMNASGAVVARRTSENGHFAEIALPPGSYTITGTFLSATVNGAHPKRTESVAIQAGYTVRQDFFLGVP